MDRKSVGLIILLWVEAIISLRVMLFSVPVMINQYLEKSFALSGLNDRFIAVMTATVSLYCIVGIVSILGYRFWKATHYLALILTFVLTFGSLYAFDQPPATVHISYFVPLIFATLFTALAGFLGRKK
jgi:hypothetical protein